MSFTRRSRGQSFLNFGTAQELTYITKEQFLAAPRGEKRLRPKGGEEVRHVSGARGDPSAFSERRP